MNKLNKQLLNILPLYCTPLVYPSLPKEKTGYYNSTLTYSKVKDVGTEQDKQAQVQACISRAKQNIMRSPHSQLAALQGDATKQNNSISNSPLPSLGLKAVGTGPGKLESSK
jgi:hypothetical protein